MGREIVSRQGMGGSFENGLVALKNDIKWTDLKAFENVKNSKLKSVFSNVYICGWKKMSGLSFKVQSHAFK
jgi:hypothetical protein